MGYQGGKDRSGKAIAAVLAPALHVGTGHYVEPFMGECGVARHVARSALSMSLSDASEDLVLLWQGQRGWSTAVAGTKAMARGVDQLFCKPVVAEILGLKVCDDGPR